MELDHPAKYIIAQFDNTFHGLTIFLSGIDPKYMVDSSTYYVSESLVSESMIKGIHLSRELYTHHKKTKNVQKIPS